MVAPATSKGTEMYGVSEQHLQNSMMFLETIGSTPGDSLCPLLRAC